MAKQPISSPRADLSIREIQCANPEHFSRGIAVFRRFPKLAPQQQNREKANTFVTYFCEPNSVMANGVLPKLGTCRAMGGVASTFSKCRRFLRNSVTSLRHYQSWRPRGRQLFNP